MPYRYISSYLYKNKIIIIISLILLSTILLWLSQLYIYNGWYTTDLITKKTIGLKYIGKATALISTILICLSFIVSKTNKIISKYLSELEIVNTNKMITKYAFILIFIDPIFININRIYNLPLFLDFYKFQNSSSFYSIGHNIGIVAILTITILTILIRMNFIDTLTKVFFRSVFGIIPFLIILHIFFVGGDISKYPLLGVWMYGWLILSIFMYAKTLFLVKTL